MTQPQPSLSLPRATLSLQVQERIREAIMQRLLKPGQRIDQNKLAEDLQVSLVPVREALKGLEAEGLVTIIPRRGAFVTEISLSDLDDLYFARALVEGETIAHAVDRMGEFDFARLHELIHLMQEATSRQHIKEFMELNREFHLTIYRVLNNEHLLQAIVTLWDRSELYRYRYMFVLRNADVVHEEHREILAACEARDAAHAKELAVRHIQHTQQGLKAKIAEELQADA
ncbi:MAG: GntR family transcriptional regulator [Chloroflexi bacterium]|nr:GntR family transcriptional regulator [Chloroflexota bacterium]